MILNVVPILPSLNLEETTCFYRDKLNFKVSAYPDYLTVYDENIEIHFYKTKDKTVCENAGCFVLVSNIEDLYITFSVLDIIHPNGKLEFKPWGIKEFSVLDNSGNLLRFGERK